MFSAFKKFGKLGALASSVARAWSPLSLWPDGILSPGMWISPRTLTSEWQDYTGTTPVAVPGTVADSANPVGLALDIRAGAPEVLGPELVVNGDFAVDLTGWGAPVNNAGSLAWASDGMRVTRTGTSAAGSQGISVHAGKRYEFVYSYSVITGASIGIHMSLKITNDINDASRYSDFVEASVGQSGTRRFTYTSASTETLYLMLILYGGDSGPVAFDNISVKEVPGNHMLQSTSAARPLASAYDGQTLGPGDTYDATGYPVFQKYDGVDDGMATATFAAGTLTSAMDCMIAVRRDSAAKGVLLTNGTGTPASYVGAFESGHAGAASNGVGASFTTWVDSVQVGAGAATTQGDLYTALPVGDWHIVEFRGLDLSAWTSAAFSSYTGVLFNGARGDILLFPTATNLADKDAARQWLADYYGVTLA